MRGQVAFESLFVLLVVLSSAIFITTLYLQTNDATIAVSIARDELFTQANLKGDGVIITQVKFYPGEGAPYIVVKTNPEDLIGNYFYLASIQNKINSATKLGTINIEVNPAP